jgi:hypothetical protein
MLSKKILIIQTSPEHTASTFLVNALYGIIEELKDKKIIGLWNENFKNEFNNIILVKSHNLNIDNLIKIYADYYNLYFICSERKERNLYIDSKYKLYNNVIVFDYFELNETSKNTIPNIINNIYNKVHKLLFKYIESDFIKLNKENGINRIIDMNNRYNEIKENPFEYIDEFYEIHGSHRKRELNNINFYKLCSLGKGPKLKF